MPVLVSLLRVACCRMDGFGRLALALTRVRGALKRLWNGG